MGKETRKITMCANLVDKSTSHFYHCIHIHVSYFLGIVVPLRVWKQLKYLLGLKALQYIFFHKERANHKVYMET